MRPVSHDDDDDDGALSILGRGSIQTLRVDSRGSGAYRSASPIFEPVQEQLRHRGERDANFSSSDHSWPGGFLRRRKKKKKIFIMTNFQGIMDHWKELGDSEDHQGLKSLGGGVKIDPLPTNLKNHKTDKKHIHFLRLVH